MLPLVEAAALVTSADQNITLPADGDKRQEFIDLNKPYSGEKQIVYLLNARRFSAVQGLLSKCRE